jgi:hypothetical protein
VTDQHLPHGRVRRHGGHGRRHLRPPDRGGDVAPAETHERAEFDARGTGRCAARISVLGIRTGVEHRERHGSVHRAGIEHLETEGSSDGAGDRRLAGTRRPVDRDDSGHAVARSASRVAANPGKDTSTASHPEMVVAPSAVSAATAAHIAMR